MKNVVIFTAISIGMGTALYADPSAAQLSQVPMSPPAFQAPPAPLPQTPGPQAYGGANQYGGTVGVQVPVGQGAVNGGVTFTGNGQIVGGHVGGTIPLGH